MKTFIALYRGESVTTAKLVAITADPKLVTLVAGQMLEHELPPEDPVLTKLEGGRRAALRQIKKEAKVEPSLAQVLGFLRENAEGESPDDPGEDGNPEEKRSPGA